MNDKVIEPDSPEDEVEILHPDRTITVAGREVTVREFRALEGMKLAELWRPIVDSLHEISSVEDSDEPGWDFLDALIERHHDALCELMARTSGQPRQWIEELPESEYLELLYAFWSANAGFFMRRLARRVRPAMTAAADPARGAEAPTEH